MLGFVQLIPADGLHRLLWFSFHLGNGFGRRHRIFAGQGDLYRGR